MTEFQLNINSIVDTLLELLLYKENKEIKNKALDLLGYIMKQQFDRKVIMESPRATGSTLNPRAKEFYPSWASTEEEILIKQKKFVEELVEPLLDF